MKKTTITLLLAFSALLFPFASKAQDGRVIDRSRPEKILTFGLRAGLNSTGVSTNYLKVQPEVIQSNFYWRMGQQAGGIVDLHLRKFLAIQVGAFWENRSYDCSMMTANAEEDYMGSMFVHNRFHFLNFPVMLSFRLNILPQAVLELDFGGYFAYGIGGKKKMDSYISFGEGEGQLIFDHTSSEPNYFGADAKDFLAVDRSDIGLKAGVGLTFFQHYFLGVYLERSLKNNAKNRFGSPEYKIRYSNWSVSLGYNF